MVNLPSLIEKGITTIQRKPPIEISVTRKGIHRPIEDISTMEQILRGFNDLCGELDQHGGDKAKINIHQEGEWNVIEIYNNGPAIAPLYLRLLQHMQRNIEPEDMPEGHSSGHYRAAAHFNNVGGSCLAMNTNDQHWPVLYLIMLPTKPKIIP